MKAIINTCTLCESSNAEILFPAFFENRVFSFENVMICKDCGLVYKHPIIPNDEKLHYMDTKQWASSYYDRKFLKSAQYVSSVVSLNMASIVLDIGAAEGHFLRKLKEVAGVTALYGIEPAKEICKIAKSKENSLRMIPYTLEETDLPNEYFDLITAFGVDYLFFDHNDSLLRLSKAIKKDGYLYIERNLFLEMPAFVTKKVSYLEDLFGTNAMLKNWFTEIQFEKQLEKYFMIETKNVFFSERVPGLKVRQVGLLCKPRNRIKKVVFENEYNKNKQFVLTMPRKTNILG